MAKPIISAVQAARATSIQTRKLTLLQKPTRVPINLPIGENLQASSRVNFFLRHWFELAGLLVIVWVGLPFLAPVFMQLGWIGPAKLIYAFYSLQCHQLPERSFFLFGKQFTYSLPQIQAAFQPTTDIALLRQFTGTPEMGWKVAWSDRMVAMYTSLPFFMGIWAITRRKVRELPFWGLVFLLLPMGIDGVSHFISDLSGLQQGFRYDNLWLAQLTFHQFSASFYRGDAWGSFNSIMRLVTGVLFGLGVTWYSLPRLHNLINASQL